MAEIFRYQYVPHIYMSGDIVPPRPLSQTIEAPEFNVIPRCPEADAQTRRKHFFLKKEAKTLAHLTHA
jgi:hypothetical protein